MKIETLNIKSDMPPADVAVASMEIELFALKKSGVEVVKVIHGYGSHGRGGEIKKHVQRKLDQLKKLQKISDYVKGEQWGRNIIAEKMILTRYPQLILDEDLKNFNNGLTVVFLKD